MTKENIFNNNIVVNTASAIFIEKLTVFVR